MSNQFDLIVLGSGPAATRVATRCAKNQWRVAVVDPRPIGGTCALRGCNPKKVLVRAAELIDRANTMRGNGASLENARINWSELIDFKRKFTEPVTASKRESFAKLGINVIRGEPRFLGTTRIGVDGREFTANRILLATGASPVELPIDGAELLTASDEFMELNALPRRVAFVGGGYISFEFAHVAARAGAEVVIVERSQPLAKFDDDLVERLVERSQQIGVQVQSHTTVQSIRRQEDGSFLVDASNGKTAERIETDLVVHGAGRAPSLAGLNLEQANVQYDKQRGIEVNEYFQSVSNEAVYAAGDAAATGLPALTAAANYQGRAVAKNLIEGNVVENRRPEIPTTVFTAPALAAIGLTEAQAKRRGVSCDVLQGDWAEFNSIKKLGETHAMYKILVDPDRGRILGAHLLGPDAAELINLFALAIQHDLPADALAATHFVFPTLSSDVESMLRPPR